MGWQDLADPIATSAPPPQAVPEWLTALADPAASLPGGLARFNAPKPREAQGMADYIQAAFQNSATGLAIRGKMPDVVMGADAPWYGRAAAGVSGLASDVPLMIPGWIGGAAVGAPLGGAAGSVVPAVGNVAGAAGGAFIGGNAGANALPAAVRQTLIQAYTNGEIKDATDFAHRAGAVLWDTFKAGTVGAVAGGAGLTAKAALMSRAGIETATAAKLATAATSPKGLTVAATEMGIAPAEIALAQQVLSKGTTAATDLTAQITAMTMTGAALEGRLPELHEFLDAAILLGGLHVTGSTVSKLSNIYAQTGKRPADVLKDITENPGLKDEILGVKPGEREKKLLTAEQERLFLDVGVPIERQGHIVPEAPAEMTPTAILDAAKARIAELEAKVELTKVETAEKAILDKAKDSPEALATTYGVKLADENANGRRETISQVEDNQGLPPKTAKIDVQKPEVDPFPKPIKSAKDEHPDVQEMLKTMATDEAGWAEVGGRLVRTPTGDRVGEEIISRTKWIPKAEWWPGRPGGLSEAKTKAAVEKSLRGEKLNAAEKRAVDYMTEIARERVLSVRGLGEEEWSRIADELKAEGHEPITPHVNNLDLVARAAALDEAAVERAAIAHADDDAAFFAEIRRIVDEKDQAQRVPENGQAGEPAPAGQQAGAAANTGTPGQSGTGPGTGSPGTLRFAEHPVYRQVKDQLDAIGKFTDEQNDAAARVIQAYYDAMAERTGKPLAELMELIPPVKFVRDEGAPGDTLNQSDRPIFHSELARQLDKAPIKAAPAKEWGNYIKGLANKGVKAEEVKWSGLEDWLALQPGKVTKEQVNQFLQEGGVKVEEAQLHGEQVEPDLRVTDRNIIRDEEDRDSGSIELTYEDRDSGHQFYVTIDGEAGNVTIQGPGGKFIDDSAPMNRQTQDTAERAITKWLQDRAGAGSDGPAKFSSYQLPGGENYKELLLTLPPKASELDTSAWQANQIRAKSPITGKPEYEVVDGAGQKIDTVRTASTPEEALEIARKGRINRPADAFRSSHFDQPNILAHVRFNERTDADGKKVLFLEEIQSDWAQQGKKGGFAQPTKVEIKEHSVTPNKYIPDGKQFEVMVDGESFGTFNTRAEADARAATAPKQQGSTPAGPFVGKTEAWVALAMKRMIRYAADNGFDRVAWTTGEQQAARYDLSKQVSKIYHSKYEDGTYEVSAVGLNGREVDGAGGKMDLKKIEDNFGKEIADKISNGVESGKDDGVPYLSGENLKVGGAGMKAFYDKIIPNIANDVLKKLGGGRVEPVGITENAAGWKISSPEETASGRWMVKSSDYNSKGLQFDTKAEAETALREKIGSTEQMGFEVTPAMKEKALDSQALFQQNQGGKDNEQPRGYYDIDTNTIGLGSKSDPSTLVHEPAHWFLESTIRMAGREDAPADMKADLATIYRWFDVTPEQWASMTLDEKRPYHERWAEGFERYVADGIAPTTALRRVFERFAEWIKQVYTNLTEAGQKAPPEIEAIMGRLLGAGEAKDPIPPSYKPLADAERMREIVPGDKAQEIADKPFADQIELGPGEAPDNIHVNVQYINGPEDLKLAMLRMAEVDQENIQAQRGGEGGVKSWAAQAEESAKYLAGILGGGEDTLKILLPRDADNPGVSVRLRIMKDLTVKAAEFSAQKRDELLAAGPDASVRLKLEYLASIERSRMIQAEFLGERADVARALGALKDTASDSMNMGKLLETIGLGEEKQPQRLFQSPEERAKLAEQEALQKKLDEIIANQFGGKDPLEIAKLHKSIDTLAGHQTFAKDVTKATTWEKVIEAWKAGLVSGPITHITNLLGNGTNAVLRLPIDAIAATFGALRGAAVGDRMSMYEPIARAYGLMQGTLDGLKVAGKFLVEGRDLSKSEQYRPAIEGMKGEVIRLPFRMLGAEDALVSTMIKRGEAMTLATREAVKEGLNPNTREFAERVNTLIQSPTEAMANTIQAAGDRFTFNQELGTLGRSVQQFVKAWHLEWAVPFIRTPLNIAEEMLRVSPFAPAVPAWRAAFKEGGIARDRALAEITVGAGIFALTMAYAFQGNVSGAGSPDPGKKRGKAGVWQPYSVKVGDTWYSYQRIQPMGTLMGMAADAAEIWDHMTDEEMDKIPKMMSVAFGNAITNQTFLQGMSSVVNAMAEPQRFGPKMAQQFAGSVVPNVIAQPTALMDPMQREVYSILDAVKARVPGLRQELYPKRDYLGETVGAKERLGVISPVTEQKISDDKVRQEVARLDISVANTPKKTHLGSGTGKIGDVELTPGEKDVFATEGGKMAKDILTGLINDPGWDATPDIVQRKMIQKVFTQAHRFAAFKALPLEKRAAALEQITEKMTIELNE